MICNQLILFITLIIIDVMKVHFHKAGNTDNKVNKNKPKTKNKKQQMEITAGFVNVKFNLKNIKNNSSKKSNTKRQLTSALTLQTFAADKTLSSGKIRSKSSQEQYRRISTVTIKQLTKANIKNMITQEDNIQFTQITPRDNVIENVDWTNKSNKYYISPQRAAIIIQKAWKKYKTIRLVKEYEIMFSKTVQSSRILSQQYQKNDLQRTLKIKSLKQQLKQEKTNEIDQIHKQITQLRKNYKDSDQSSSSSVRSISKSNQKTLIKNHSKEDKNLDQIEVGSQNSQIKVQQLFKKLEYNKQKLYEKYNKKIDEIFDYHSIQSNLHQNSDINDLNSQSFNQSNRILMGDNEDSVIKWSQTEYDKIFQLRIKQESQKKQQRLRNLQKMILDKKINQRQAKFKRQCVQGEYQRSIKQTEKVRQMYQVSLRQMNGQILKLQSDRSELQKKQIKIKKSFSAESVILKIVLKEISLKQITDIPNNGIFKQNFVLQKGKSQKNLYQDLEQKKQNQKIQVNKFEVEQLIYKDLINQFVCDIFAEDKLLLAFKPYIDELFQFHKIQDQQIIKFMQTIKKYYPSSTIINQRLNQKINPNSLEILAIIRNYDYEAHEYDLILDEGVFKQTKKQIQLEYIKKQQNRLAKNNKIQINMSNQKSVKKLKLMIQQKQEKFNKYYNFERDLYIMYMKCVFNCFNELLIEEKTIFSFMNTRSSIANGELSLAIKDFNKYCSKYQAKQIFRRSQKKLQQIIKNKCSILSFTSYRQIRIFQEQINKQLKFQMQQNEFKWVNFMDEILQIWQDISLKVQEDIITQLVNDLTLFIQ